MNEIPLFPLNSVLFPYSGMELQLFEPRYLDMLSYVLQQESHFGVVLLKGGRETDRGAALFEVGTTARVTDFEQLPNGLLGINLIGVQRFRIVNTRVAEDGLSWATIEWLDNGEQEPLPAKDQGLWELLQSLALHPHVQSLGLEFRADDSARISYQLASLLPLEVDAQQQLLQLDNTQERLHKLESLLLELEG